MIPDLTIDSYRDKLLETFHGGVANVDRSKSTYWSLTWLCFKMRDSCIGILYVRYIFDNYPSIVKAVLGFFMGEL